jgi:hypothetical protein
MLPLFPATTVSNGEKAMSASPIHRGVVPGDSDGRNSGEQVADERHRVG